MFSGTYSHSMRLRNRGEGTMDMSLCALDFDENEREPSTGEYNNDICKV